MATSTMLPPQSSLGRRRTKHSTLSEKVQETAPVSRTLSLPKAETFHQSSSPRTREDPVLSIAHLSKRSTTCSRSSFATWLYDSRETAADVIADFEATFSGARGPRPAARRRSAREFEETLSKNQRPSSPVDSGLGSSIGSPSEKNLSRTLERALDLTSNKDSALGTSHISITDAESLIKAQASTGSTTAQSQVKSAVNKTTTSSARPLIIINYPVPSRQVTTTPTLSNFARRQIYKRLYAPLLNNQDLKYFHPVVIGIRQNKGFRCLRDIEQALIKQPVTLSVTPPQYRTFGELTVQLVVDTYQHLSESEQRRSSDRAYESGYFLDLVSQVQQLAAHIGSADISIVDDLAPSVDDEVTLEGGLGDSGDIAELVRWKNGQGISLRTGLPYIPMAGVKRSIDDMDNDVQFSMARHKKGYIPELVDMPCTFEGCDRSFKRKCDLSKHERTHSRPFKCKVEGCEFYERGLPTEKELDRHWNDRHKPNPTKYVCKYKHTEGCLFDTKRESNLKQHMEKKHGWVYERAKGKGKGRLPTPSQTPQTPAFDVVTQSPVLANQWATTPSLTSTSSSPYQSTMNPVPYGQQSYATPIFRRQSDDMAIASAPWGSVMNSQHMKRPQTSIQTPNTPAYSLVTASPLTGANTASNMDFDFNAFNYPTGNLLTPDMSQVSGGDETAPFGQNQVYNAAAYNLDLSAPFSAADINGFDAAMPINGPLFYDNTSYDDFSPLAPVVMSEGSGVDTTMPQDMFMPSNGQVQVPDFDIDMYGNSPNAFTNPNGGMATLSTGVLNDPRENDAYGMHSDDYTSDMGVQFFTNDEVMDNCDWDQFTNN